MAIWDQDSFRFRNDDGSETTATWKAGKNVDAYVLPDENIRVRFIIQETNGDSATGQIFYYDFRVNSGSWTALESSGALISATTSNYDHGSDSTQQIGSGTYIADNDGMCENTYAVSGGVNNDFAGSDEEETEICVQVNSSSASSGDKIEIRIVDSSFAPLDVQTNIPLMTVTDYLLTADTGSFSLAGVANNLKISRRIIASNGEFNYSGIVTNLTVSKKITASSGSFTLTGIDVALDVGGSVISEIAGATSLNFTTSGDLKGAGDLAGDTSLTFSTSGDVESLASGSIEGTTSLIFVSSGVLKGQGALAGNTGIVFDANGAVVDLGGVSEISGSTSLTFSTSGYLGVITEAVVIMEPAPIKEGLLGGLKNIIQSQAWVQWFTKLTDKPALAVPNDKTKFLRGDDTWTEIGADSIGYHASSHEVGGGDELDLAQSQITNLTTDLANKTSSTHDHNGGDGGTIDHVNLANVGNNTHAQIDTHIDNANIHINHTTVNIIAGTGLTGGGDISANRTLSTNDSAIDHDSLLNFLAIEHIDWTSASNSFDTTGTFKVGDASNQLNIATDGTLRLVGDATSWDDLRVPMDSSKLGGSKNPDYAQFKDDGSGSQGVFIYWFNKSAEEELYFTIQMPHAWKQGSNVVPHVHWTPSANGAANEFVKWGFEYTWSNVSGNYSNTTIIYTDAANAAGATVQGDASMLADKHYLSTFSEVSGSGKTLSSMMICRIFRDATDSDDDYDDDAGLMEFDLHYQLNSFGSDEEYTKA